MSFIYDKTQGVSYNAGWFLADNEKCTRKTREMTQEMATTTDKGKYVPMGTVYPSNDASAEGIVYEPVDVTSGNMPGSVVLSGVVYENRLPEISDEAKTTLEAKGFVFVTESEVTRAY